ncbi:hypothetical protein EVAR_5277_1 [Eumeta japonica]|uniref:Uncharacterized protein n=1 Tax=Eumeta variegata TaxID=151549 RepID=A0A4C1TN17_EUMVA|nr:hypothetical protein EVAR_5277_1 [Eumeta japonica]
MVNLAAARKRYRSAVEISYLTEYRREVTASAAGPPTSTDDASCTFRQFLGPVDASVVQLDPCLEVDGIVTLNG